MAAAWLTDRNTAIEVGCGSGVVARGLAEQTGARVIGLDVSPDCIRHAGEHNRHELVEYVESSLENFAPPRTGASVVTMYEVIEHIDDPIGALSRIRDWLTPRGVLIVSTPNRTSLQLRIRRLPGLRAAYQRVTGTNAYQVAYGHVDEYGFDELRNMLESAGFSILREDGACLVVPFQQALAPLARSELVCRLNVASGSWAPRLALHSYFVARRT